MVQHCSHCVVTVFTLLRGSSSSCCAEPVIMLHAWVGVEAVFFLVVPISLLLLSFRRGLGEGILYFPTTVYGGFAVAASRLC